MKIETDYGYIKLHKKPDKGWWIEEFVILKQYRGKGLARKLAELLPTNCSLLAYPLVKRGPGLSLKDLVGFYKSIGFKLRPDADKNNIMIRKVPTLAERFPNDLWGAKARARARAESINVK